jgi:hypothetical protein
LGLDGLFEGPEPDAVIAGELFGMRVAMEQNLVGDPVGECVTGERDRSGAERR